MAGASRRPSRILFISNGHGEDAIAAAIAARLPAGVVAQAYPTLGSGRDYAGICEIVGPRANLPSQGSRVTSGTIKRDIGAGALSMLWPGLQFLRQARSRYDRVAVIGDMLGVLACALAGIGGIIYVDVYKTGFGRHYSGLEKVLIRRAARTVFSRSDALANELTTFGVDARAAGNVMLDTLPMGSFDMASSRTHALAITLLPGSRTDAAANLKLQVGALRLLGEDLMPDAFVAIAVGVSVDELATAANLRHAQPPSPDHNDLGTLSDGQVTLHFASGRAIGMLLMGSDLVLSQAGTATVQALGLGKPVITFTRAKERRSRFLAEQALFGEGRIAADPNPEAIAAAMRPLLRDLKECERRGSIGRGRVGSAGAIGPIIAELLA